MPNRDGKLQETYTCPDCGDAFEYAHEPQSVERQDDGTTERVSGDPPRPRECPTCGNTDGVFTVATVNGVKSFQR